MKPLEKKLLEQMFFEVARQCDGLEPMIWFEQDLIRKLAEGEDDHTAPARATRLVRRHVDRAWKRLLHQRHRQRARLQLALFDPDRERDGVAPGRCVIADHPRSFGA